MGAEAADCAGAAWLPSDGGAAAELGTNIVAALGEDAGAKLAAGGAAGGGGE
ncbi:MAG: hypothetical protein IPI49_01185 [Myxococcales bacterium]|nr:hypothetical protein [Myxococcales bacterium]